MINSIVLIIIVYSFIYIETEAVVGECLDYNGRSITPGLHYIPGTTSCYLCICDNGNPRWCKTVLCKPPEKCKSFRVSTDCCEFICLDDHLGNAIEKENVPHEMSADFGLRLIIGAITSILSLSILTFGIHRLRQRKMRGRQNQIRAEQGSIGFITGSLRYLPECDYEGSTTHYSLWKPGGYYAGEAPPPYEEAVAAARVEAAISARVNPSINAPGPSLVIHTHSHRTIPMTLATSCPIGSTIVVSEASSQPNTQHREITSTCPLTDQQSTHSSIITPRYDDSFNHHKTIPKVHQSNVEVGIDVNINVNINDVGVTIEENDDYRSECENCNVSAGQDQDYFMEDLETMTLHRKPHEPETQTSAIGPFYRTSLTLPTKYRKPAPIHASVKTGARENWFSSMPESASSSEEE